MAFIGFAVAILSFLASHGSNGGGPAGPKQGKLLFCFFLLCIPFFAATGCTSFVTATGQSGVITSITQRCFGVNVGIDKVNETPTVQLGLITTTIQFMPTRTNNAGQICAPDYAATFDVKNNASPFTFDGDETFASGHDATYKATGQTV